MKPLSFIIVGSGWRSLFYVRIAKRYPELFCLKYLLCRTEEKAARIAAEYDITATTSVELCEQCTPDFVVVAINKAGLVHETLKWANKGFAVLCETPAGLCTEDLRSLWEAVCHGAKIQIAEQYHRYPVLAAGLKAVEKGLLGNPYAVSLSLAHEYHGISMIRRMFGSGSGKKVKLINLCGEKYTFPVTETDSRNGAVTDGSVGQKERALIRMKFEITDQSKENQVPYQGVAFYDFSGVLYHSFIRTRHINVQGQDGEWNDTTVRYVAEDYLPKEMPLTGYFAPEHGELVTEELREQGIQWQPVIDMAGSQDEYAIATMMYDMRAYIRDGEEVYPMAEALEDAYLTILFQEALDNPGKEMMPDSMPWDI